MRATDSQFTGKRLLIKQSRHALYIKHGIPVVGVCYANFFVVYNAIIKFPDNDPIMLRNGPIMLMVLAIILVKSSIKSA